MVSESDSREEFGLDKYNRPIEYISNKYELYRDIVIDHETNLMWEQSGSGWGERDNNSMLYIAKLNRERFTGYSNWRLPTVEELMSLIEEEIFRSYLYINEVFDQNKECCLSADKRSSDSAWIVNFFSGEVVWRDLDSKNYAPEHHVRAVRSLQ